MATYVNGYSYPMFKIFTSTGTLIESINLDYCGNEGLVETVEFISVKHNYTDYSTAMTFSGVHYYFDLSYVDYSDKTNTLAIKRILNYAIDGNKIILYPRSDVLCRMFEVLLISDNISIGIMKGGYYSVGNRLLKIKFRTKDLQPYVDFVNPDDLAVILDDYIIKS